MVIINGMLVHYRIVCSQLPAAIVKKLCLVAQVEYDVRHSGLVHDMSKVRILHAILVDWSTWCIFIGIQDWTRRYNSTVPLFK